MNHFAIKKKKGKKEWTKQKKKKKKEEKKKQGKKERLIKEREDVGRKISRLGWPKKNSLVIDAGWSQTSPYLVSHRRIINVIRIMYPRKSNWWKRQRGREGNREGESVQERANAYLCCGIYRWEAKAVRGGACVQRERRRCRHERSPQQGRTYLYLSLSLFLFLLLFFQPPRRDVSEVYRQAHVLCILRFLFVYTSKTCVYCWS